MSIEVPVEGFATDWFKNIGLGLLQKFLGVNLAEFKAALSSGDLDKVGNIIRKVLTSLGYSTEGKAIDELLDAFAAKNWSAVCRESGDVLHLVADHLDGVPVNYTPRILLSAGSPIKADCSTEAVLAKLDLLEKAVAPRLSAGDAAAGIDPKQLAEIIGYILQAIAFIAAWWKDRSAPAPVPDAAKIG